MRIFVNILLNITVFGAGIPNILVGMFILSFFYFILNHKNVSRYNFFSFRTASQNLQLIGQRISDDEFQFSFCYWLILLGVVLCPVMWLGSPKNMKYLFNKFFLKFSYYLQILIALVFCEFA